MCGGMHLKIKWDTVRTGGLPRSWNPGTRSVHVCSYYRRSAAAKKLQSHGGRGNLALTNQNDEREGLGR